MSRYGETARSPLSSRPSRAWRSSRQIRGARGAVVAIYGKDVCMTSKRQQTMAKMTRERAVREKREKKQEKKRAAAAERKALAAGGTVTGVVDGELGPALGPDGELLEAAPTDGAESSDALLDPHQPDRDDGPVLGESVVSGL